MAPKGKAKPPPPPPEPDPEQDLPEDVRSLEAAPFPVKWKPLLFLVFLDEGLDQEPAVQYLVEKQKLCKFVDFDTLAAQVDPESDLGKDISEAEREHESNAGTGDFSLPPALTVAVLEQKFSKDSRYAWKAEYIQRKEELAKAQGTRQECEANVQEKKKILDGKESEYKKLQEQCQNVGQEASAGEDPGTACPPTPSEHLDSGRSSTKTESSAVEFAKEVEKKNPEPTQEEKLYVAAHGDHESAVQRLAEADAVCKEAENRMGEVFTSSQLYWIGGLSDAERTIAMINAGFSLRAAIFLRGPPSEEQADVREPSPLPQAFADLKTEIDKSSWDGPFGQSIAIEATPGRFSNLLNGALPTSGGGGDAEEPPQGAKDLCHALLGLKSSFAGYDTWRERTRIYKLEAVSQDQSRYDVLMQSVPEERASVPVVLFAMLEQVCRDAVGGGDEEDQLGSQKDAETVAEEIMGTMFKSIANLTEGLSVESGDDTKEGYSLVYHGDDFGRAACGLTTGFIHTQSTEEFQKNFEKDDGHSQNLFAKGAPFTVNVNAVEEHMMKLWPIPGVHRREMPECTGIEHEEVDMERSALRAICNDIPLAQIERYQMMKSMVDMLPDSVRDAHGEEVLSRRYFEQMFPTTLIQAMMKAEVEYPHKCLAYDAKNDALLVAHCCSSHNDEHDISIPCMRSFCHYWSEFESSCGQVDNSPEQVYSLAVPESSKVASSEYFFPPDGSIARIGTGGCLHLSKGRTSLSFRHGSDSNIVATFDGRTVLSISQPTPGVDERNHGMEFTVGTAGGVQISINSMGQIRMNKTPSTEGTVLSARGVEVQGAPIEGVDLSVVGEESFRCILADGSVVKRVTGQELAVFHPGGEVSTRMEQGTNQKPGWAFAGKNGQRIFISDEQPLVEPSNESQVERGEGNTEDSPHDPSVPADQESPQTDPAQNNPPKPFPMEALASATLKDPNTQAMVTTRDDLLMIVEYPTGERVIEHSDGTRVIHDGEEWTVESNGFPAVRGTASEVSVEPCPGFKLVWNRASESMWMEVADGPLLVGNGGFVHVVQSVDERAPSDKAVMASSCIQHAQRDYTATMGEYEMQLRDQEKRREERAEAAAAQAEADENQQGKEENDTDGAENGKVQEVIEEEPPVPHPFGGRTCARAVAAHEEMEGFLFDLVHGEAAFVHDCVDFYLGPDGSSSGIPGVSQENGSEGLQEVDGQKVEAGNLGRSGAKDPKETPDAGEKQKGDKENTTGGEEGIGGDTTKSQQELEQETVTEEDDSEKQQMTPPAAAVAPYVKPRVFVVQQSGDGFEILDSNHFETFYDTLSCDENTTVQACNVPSASQSSFNFPVPVGSHGHTFVTQLQPVSPLIDPLPLSPDSNPHTRNDAGILDSLKRPSIFSAKAHPVAPGNLTIPRVTGIKTTQKTRPFPVVLFREIVELPKWNKLLLTRIESILEKFAARKAALQEDEEGLAPEETTSGQSARAKELANQVKEMRERALHSGNVVIDQLNARDEAQRQAEEQARLDASEADRLAIEARKKPYKAREPKIGPYDHTPKRPCPGEVLKYAEAEEGIKAYESNSELRNKDPTPTRDLQSVTVEPASPGKVGMPGVYFRCDPFEETPGAIENGSTRQSTREESPNKLSNDSGTAARKLSPYQNVDFEYPEYGYDLLKVNQPIVPSLKSMMYAVNCQPRRVLPPLPFAYAREEAEMALNARFLSMEGDVLRVSNTASGNLVRMQGKGLKQFQLSPAHIHFGNVQAGNKVKRTALLTNVSMERARFHVVRPDRPLAASYTTGALAAGMTTTIAIEIRSDVVGDFVGEIVVKSEFNLLRLTCSAKITEGHEGLNKEGRGLESAASVISIGESAGSQDATTTTA